MPFVQAPAASGGERRAKRSQFFIHYKNREQSNDCSFFCVSRGFARSVAAWPTHLRDPEFGALRSSVSEEDIGQYTNKFAIANIYLVGLSGLPKFLVAWSAQACCDRSNPSKGRKRGACLYILCIIYRYFLPITAKYNYICVGIGMKLCR